MRLLVELSGESVELARAECLAVAEAENGEIGVQRKKLDGRALVLDTDAAPETLAGRLALAWSVSEHLLSCPIQQLEKRLAGTGFPHGTFRVKVERLDPEHPPELARAMTQGAGALLAREHGVDLEDPDFELKILLAERAHVGILMHSIDRGSFESRKSENRVFNHPISMHPRLARALVNLTGVKRGQFLLDPFCGTGGLLLEAALVGAAPIGGDIDARMVEGSKDNLFQFGIDGVELQQVDVGEWPSLIGQVDAIATDPPYGRASSTKSEPIRYLYKRAFESFCGILRDGGRVAMVLPDKKYARIARGRFKLLSSYPTRVHRSLTRHFCVFERDSGI